MKKASLEYVHVNLPLVLSINQGIESLSSLITRQKVEKVRLSV